MDSCLGGSSREKEQGGEEHGTYEQREFVPMESVSFKEQPLTDIYIFKAGFTQVGVKIRNPDITKKGNFKFKSIEVKLLVERTEEVERWVKHEVRLQKKYKLRKEAELALNDLLKRELEKVAEENNLLREWLLGEIDCLVRIDKCKRKELGREVGTLRILRAFGESPSALFFRTASIQHHHKREIPAAQSHNTSYPSLLQSLFSKPS